MSYNITQHLQYIYNPLKHQKCIGVTTMKYQSMLCRTSFSIFIFLVMLNFSFSQIPTVNWTALSNPKYANRSLDMAAGYSGGITTIYYCTNGGFYKSTNDGTTWTQITTLSPLPKVIACEAANPNIIYVADGSTYLKKSTNGGSAKRGI